MVYEKDKDIETHDKPDNDVKHQVHIRLELERNDQSGVIQRIEIDL